MQEKKNKWAVSQVTYLIISQPENPAVRQQISAPMKRPHSQSANQSN